MPWNDRWDEQDQHKGRLDLVLRLLRRRFGVELTDELIEKILKLSSEKLLEFGDALIDFRKIADAQLWLASHDQ